MLETSILDLSNCQTSDEVRAAAHSFWSEIHPLPEKPELTIYRPALIKAQRGRLWFETVVQERHYSRDTDAELHLRTHGLQDDEEMTLQEAKVMYQELGKAIEVMEALQAYAAALDAWNAEMEQGKRDLTVFQNECLKTWSEQLKKK